MLRLPRKSLDGIPTDENSISFERDIPDDIVLEIARHLLSPEILKFCLLVGMHDFSSHFPFLKLHE
jgi:hypothetical protein